MPCLSFISRVNAPLTLKTLQFPNRCIEVSWIYTLAILPLWFVLSIWQLHFCLPIYVHSIICPRSFSYYTKMCFSIMYMQMNYYVTVTCILNLGAILVFYCCSCVPNQHRSKGPIDYVRVWCKSAVHVIAYVNINKIYTFKYFCFSVFS